MTKAEKQYLREIINRLVAIQSNAPKNLVYRPTPSTVVSGKMVDNNQNDLVTCIEDLSKMVGDDE